MQKVLILSLVLHSATATDCRPGKYTGISCPSPRDVIREFNPQINTLKTKFNTVHKTTGDSIASTRLLIRNNILHTKNQISQKFITTRSLLNEAKLEAAKAAPSVQACIARQNLELAKIQVANFLDCHGNFSHLVDLKKEILDLELVCNNLGNLCSRLNPIGSESVSLRLCLDEKIKDLQVQLLRLEQKVAEGVKEVVNLSTDCVVRESGEVHSKIGAIEGSVRNCKDVRF